LQTSSLICVSKGAAANLSSSKNSLIYCMCMFLLFFMPNEINECPPSIEFSLYTKYNHSYVYDCSNRKISPFFLIVLI